MEPKCKYQCTGTCRTYLEILLAIFVPPLGVVISYRFKKEFWICLLLTILGYIPGIAYALYVLLRPSKPNQPTYDTSESEPSTFV